MANGCLGGRALSPRSGGLSLVVLSSRQAAHPARAEDRNDDASGSVANSGSPGLWGMTASKGP